MIIGTEENSIPQEEQENTITDRQWLANYLHLEPDDDFFSLMGDFVLYWSLFEKVFFDKDCTSDKLENWNEPFVIDEANCEAFISTLRKWYLNPDGRENNSAIRKLYHDREKPNKKYLIDGMKSSNMADRKRAIAIVVFRYRNNMFHGEKEIAENVGRYRELFFFANRFLRDCLKAKIERKNAG